MHACMHLPATTTTPPVHHQPTNHPTIIPVQNPHVITYRPTTTPHLIFFIIIIFFLSFLSFLPPHADPAFFFFFLHKKLMHATCAMHPPHISKNSKERISKVKDFEGKDRGEVQRFSLSLSTF